MRWLLATMAMLVSLMGGIAMAGEKEVAALTAVLAPGPVDATLYSSEFLAAVPPTTLQPILDDIRGTIGAVISIEPRSGMTYAVETASHDMLAEISLDAAGKISGLLLHPPTPENASTDDVLAAMRAVAPQSAFLVTRNGETLHASNPDTALAVGSAFKLAILKILAEDIAAGERKWSDVVTLESGDISLPSGMPQGWPVGSPLTLHTLAALMISISDNTATDRLLRLVGRERVEAAMGSAPVLTTRELFTLKANPDLKARYLAADLSGKRGVLEEADRLPVPDSAQVATPHDVGVEFYITPTRLCALIEDVAGLDVTQINPGVAHPTDWAKIAFKGGSEIGVLALVTALVAKDGAHFCVSAIWNAPTAIDQTKASTAYAGMLAVLNQRR